MKNLSDVMLNMKNKRLEEQKAIKNKSKKILSEGKLIWTSEIEATDGYIDEQDYEIVREDFEENILPSIKNQCRNDVLIMAGTVGRWNGNSKGGTVIDVDNLLGFGDVDEVSIEEENGQLIWKGSHHDGTHYMGLYTIPEDEMSRKKIVKDFGIIEWLEDIYDYRSKEDCMEDALSRLDDVESLKDCLSIEDYSKANEYFKPITGAGITENKKVEDCKKNESTNKSKPEYKVFKRTAIDGKSWWIVASTDALEREKETGKLNQEGKYKTRKEAEYKKQQLEKEQNTVKESIDTSEYTHKDIEFKYRLLSRLQQDCKYFLGNGNGTEKHLWAGNVDDQIKMMKDLYNSFSDNQKPEWISMEEIEGYEKEMKSFNNGIDENKIVTEDSRLPNISKFIYNLDKDEGNAWSVTSYTEDGNGNKIIIVRRNGLSYNTAKDIIEAVEEKYPQLKGHETENHRGIWFYLKDSKEENKETVTEADEVTIQGLVNAQNIANQFKNYKAFEPNFGPLIIIKSGNDFLVYKANATEYNQYVYSSDNKDNIEGWLYGAVQAKNGMLNENKEVTEDRVHRELHRGDEFKNENGVTVIIYDVDDKGQVTYKIGNEIKCNNKDSVVSMLNQNGYKAIIENKEIVEGIDEETLNLIDKNYGINEDQYDNERRKGRPSAKKIAEQEYYDNEEWYKEHIKDYKNIDDFVQQEIFNIASEYNLKEDTAIQTCKEIYNLATNQ